MSETEEKTQGQKPKICQFSVWSLMLGIISFLLISLISLNIYFGIPSILGLLLGLKAYQQIKKSEGQLYGMIHSIAGIGISGICLVFIFLFAIIPTIKERIELARRPMTYDGTSADLQKTIIVPTLDTPFSEGKNIIWCSSFQLAWNALRDDVIGEPVQVTDAGDIANRLNTAKQSSSDLLEESYYASAGFVEKGIIEEIQSEMAKRFPDVPKPTFGTVGPDWIIAYGYLEAYVKFTIPFLENKHKFVFKDSQGKEDAVTSFGIWDGFSAKYRKVMEQVDVLYSLQDPEDQRVMFEFAVDLCKYTEPYQIVAACIEPKETLAETLTYLQEKIADVSSHRSGNKLGSTDMLIVPNMFWKVKHRFQELEGRPLANKGYEGMPINEASQMILFRLDRTGAILKSESKIAVLAAPRYFIFDRPFLIYIKKRDAVHPFFVMWVDNAELLTKWQV